MPVVRLILLFRGAHATQRKVKGKGNLGIPGPKIDCIKYAHVNIFRLPRDSIVSITVKQTLK